MKLSKRSIQLFTILFLGTVISSFGQCGAGVENIAITNYCNNQFASWTITNPGVGASYRWMTTIPSDLSNPSATPGNQILGISSTASSITRLAHPTGTATGQIQYYYVKETASTAVPWPGSIASPGGDGTPFRMTFTTTSTMRMNSIGLPLFIYNDNQRRVQVQIQGPSGYNNFSPVFNYSRTTLTTSGGSSYLVDVPINLTLTSTGVYTITGIRAPGSGTGDNSDPFNWTNGSFAGFTNPSLRIQGGTLNPIYSGTNSSVMYNWNYTAYCGPNPSGFSFPVTTGCCTPVYINPTIGSSTNIIQTGVDAFTITSVNFSECTGAGCYFQWYKNGVSITGANGLNKTSYVATSSGIYTSRIVLNSSFINNQSCYSQSSWNMDERAIFASVTTPGVGPYCIGDKFYFNSTVTGSNVTWVPGSGLSSTNTKSTIYTANSTGSVQVIVSANITSGDKIINGSFESGVIGPNGSSPLTLQPNPGQANNTYTISNVVPNNTNGGTNTFWQSCTGDGQFFIGNLDGNNNNTIYQQTVIGLTPGQTYTLSFDLTNISRTSTVLTDPADVDVRIAVAINNTTIGGIYTSAANGLNSNICRWTTNTVNWTAPAGVTSANIVLRQVQSSSSNGHDFGLDNIRFGGLVTQDAKITIGPINDCSSITAFATGCSGTSATLTASVTGGMVFDHWENSLGTVVGTNATLSLSSTSGGVYTAFGILPLQSVLQNGDFSKLNADFLAGNPTYYKFQSTFNTGGDNAFIVTDQTSAGNSPWWLNLVSPVASSPYMFVADAKQWNSFGAVGNKVLGWNFTATAGDRFRFSGYVANQHSLVNQPATGTMPANIGVAINNVTLTSLALPANNNWNFLSAIWTAPTTGSYTLDVLNLYNYSGPGNDFVLAGFGLQPLFGISGFKTATVTSPVCVLSIELQSFEVSKKSNGVQLDWKTFSNKNKNGFYIERSNDGINFTTIGFVDSPILTNNGSETFTFLDKKPLEDVNYYRLRQVDLNGKEDYSEIKSINLQEYAIQIYPNPNNGLFTISWGVKNTFAKILIYNALGTLVCETESEPYTSSKDISLQNLASGLYSAIISTNGATQTIKLVKE